MAILTNRLPVWLLLLAIVISILTGTADEQLKRDWTSEDSEVCITCQKEKELDGEDERLHGAKFYTGREEKEVIVDCHPQKSPTEERCLKQGCAWEPSEGVLNIPACRFKVGSHGYKLVEDPVKQTHGYRFKLNRISSPSLFGEDVQRVDLLVDYETESRIRVKFFDPENARYEVPVLSRKPDKPPSQHDALYDVNWTNDPQFGIRIKRRSTGLLVFDTAFPGFIFSDQFLQITTSLPTDNVYGLGEHYRETFKRDMGWRRWSIFSAGKPYKCCENLYGSHPFFTNVDQDGDTHGVFLKNSNAMDVTMQPNPHSAITFRTIGGILDFYIFLGPTPEDVVQQYTEAIGRPAMPPYWSLGFMLTRWEYNNTDTFLKVKDRNMKASLPLDVMFADIDYMHEYLMFTYDRQRFHNLPDVVDDMHKDGMKFVTILDPVISSEKDLIEKTRAHNSPDYNLYADGLGKDVFLKNAEDDEPIMGDVWGKNLVFPDYTNPSTEKWWQDWIQYFYDSEGVRFDGVWIDMNEPTKKYYAGFNEYCSHNRWNYPPYPAGVLGSHDTGAIYNNTLCMDARQHLGRHYDLHSLYGHTQAVATFNALRNLFPKKRPFILTRSSYAGTSQFATHWLGDNYGSWKQLKTSIISILDFSLFGFPLTGHDICGFFLEASEELCTRWMQLGAFYPFSRNHNIRRTRDQDPAVFGAKLMSAARNALLTKYRLLPYLYTLMHFAHVDGSTVSRPVLHEFVSDKSTWTIDEQFLWGSALLISPALYKGQREVTAYFPKARWFDYYSGNEILPTGQRHNVAAPIEHINLHVRGGYIIPCQDPDVTTTKSRKNPLELIVALDEKREAEGYLFLDDGESFDTYGQGKYHMLKFNFYADELHITVLHTGYKDALNLVIRYVVFYGLDRPPSRIIVDGQPLSESVIEPFGGNVGAYRVRTSIQHLDHDHVVRVLTF